MERKTLGCQRDARPQSVLLFPVSAHPTPTPGLGAFARAHCVVVRVPFSQKYKDRANVGLYQGLSPTLEKKTRKQDHFAGNHLAGMVSFIS
jgi:hypothetical protein